MLRHRFWREFVRMTGQNGWYCLRCVEMILGWTLVRSDFNLHSRSNQVPTSKAHAVRLTARHRWQIFNGQLRHRAPAA
jgi:hypothetical protein